MRLALALIALSVAATLISQPAAADPTTRVQVLAWQGAERLYRLHNAEAASGGPAPLVVSLHGYRKREEAIEARDAGLDRIAFDKLEELATTEGFVVVQPAALWGRWSMFDGLAKPQINTTLDDGRQIDDEGFVFAVVERLIAGGLADPGRIYLTGISDGAIMSYRLLCRPAQPFAAAAPLIGTMYDGHRAGCLPTQPAPILVIAGTNDRILPYDGWIFPTGREVSVPETMEHWRLVHGCTGQKGRRIDDRDPGDGSRIVEIEWTGCSRDGAVKLLRVVNGGHTLPSRTPVSADWAERAGGHNRDIETAEEVWRFLSAFRRDG